MQHALYINCVLYMGKFCSGKKLTNLVNCELRMYLPVFALSSVEQLNNIIVSERSMIELVIIVIYTN